MAKPPNMLLDVWKGNTFRRRFASKQKNTTTGALSPVDLRGSTMVLTVAWAAGTQNGVTWLAGTLRKEFPLALDSPSAELGEYEITLTVEETRRLPIGQIAKYEIERWMGDEQKTVLYGTFRVGGWVNDDATPV